MQKGSREDERKAKQTKESVQDAKVSVKKCVFGRSSCRRIKLKSNAQVVSVWKNLKTSIFLKMKCRQKKDDCMNPCSALPNIRKVYLHG